MKLYSKIKSRDAKVLVVGLGYVGVPLAMNISEEGFYIIGLDKSKQRVDDLNNGVSPFATITNKQVSDFSKNPKVQLTNDIKQISNANIIIICLPTPLDNHYQPDLSIIEEFLLTSKEHVLKDTLILLESTTWPGTTEEILVPLFEKEGFEIGKDLYIGYSPEREDPGNPISIKEIPKIISGYTIECKNLISAFYSVLFNVVHLVKDCKTAEFTKLVENIQRMVNISLVNDLKVISSKMGIDMFEVIDAASTKPFGFTPYYPGPGLGGHCIPIDPFYLSWKAKEFGLNTRFIELSGEINVNVRNYVVNGVIEELNLLAKSTNGSKILVIGVSYKKNVSDVRESPAIYIIERLLEKGAHISYHDKYNPKLELSLNGNSLSLCSLELNKSTITEHDITVILTDHDYINYQEISDSASCIIDTRGVKILRNQKHVKIY